MCAWIERARDDPTTRCLYAAQAETLGGKIRGDIVEAPFDQRADDLDALLDYAKAHGAADS